MSVDLSSIIKLVEDSVRDELHKQYPKLPAENPTVKASWDNQASIAGVIAQVIIQEFMTQALVTVNVTTAGTATAQTGTGTGKIT